MKNLQVERRISKGFIQAEINDLALQKIIELIKHCHMKKDKLIKIKLSACNNGDKQRAVAYDEYDSLLKDICFFCDDPKNVDLIAYEYEDNKQLICLEDECTKSET